MEQKVVDKKKLYTVQEVCVLVGVSYNTILKRRKRLGVNPNKDNLYNDNDVKRLSEKPLHNKGKNANYYAGTENE